MIKVEGEFIPKTAIIEDIDIDHNLIGSQLGGGVLVQSEAYSSLCGNIGWGRVCRDASPKNCKACNYPRDRMCESPQK